MPPFGKDWALRFFTSNNWGTSLPDGLRRGVLPPLRVVYLSAQIGDQGATALAPALTKRALPALENLSLSRNQIGDAGLTA